MNIPIDKFGKDHWSTFMYIETCCVDFKGRVEPARMRSDGGRYPTHIKGAEITGHSDWDCADDLEAAGLLENLGTGVNRVFKLTPAGWEMASKLRQHRANGRNCAEFNP